MDYSVARARARTGQPGPHPPRQGGVRGAPKADRPARVRPHDPPPRAGGALARLRQGLLPGPRPGARRHGPETHRLAQRSRSNCRTTCRPPGCSDQKVPAARRRAAGEFRHGLRMMQLLIASALYLLAVSRIPAMLRFGKDTVFFSGMLTGTAALLTTPAVYVVVDQLVGGRNLTKLALHTLLVFGLWQLRVSVLHAISTDPKRRHRKSGANA